MREPLEGYGAGASRTAAFGAASLAVPVVCRGYARDVNDDEDVPSGIDLRLPHDAHAWTAEADVKRPYRVEARALIAERVAAHGARRVLELGGGPGLLAEAIVARQPVDYMLLDFSEPMLALARQRNPGIACVLRDFLDPAWPDGLGTFDAIVTMQAVHELRHKRRAQLLYTQALAVLAPGGLLVVADHEPPETRVRARDLHATVGEQHAYLGGAGYRDVETIATFGTLYVIAARATR